MTRSKVIWKHIDNFINGTSCSMETFATVVMEEYHKRVPEHQRVFHFSDVRDAHERAFRNAKKLRYLQHEARFATPADLEEAMVAALNVLGYDDYRSLQTELAKRHGNLAVLIPEEAQDHEDVAALMTETAQAIEAVATMLKDKKRIGPEDVQFADKAINELLDVASAAHSLIHRIETDCKAPALKAVS